MRRIYFIISTLAVLLLNSCGKDDIDDVKPVIDMNASGTFPTLCDTLKKATEIEFKVNFSDNIELGSFSIDIHHNFDQHSHSTSVETCQMDAKKTAINPWTYIKSFQIPEGLKEYTAIGEISVPTNIDPGDYHFMYKVTDKSGWQTIHGFSIKIID
jgi:hypothetical protein